MRDAFDIRRLPRLLGAATWRWRKGGRRELDRLVGPGYPEAWVVGLRAFELLGMACTLFLNGAGLSYRDVPVTVWGASTNCLCVPSHLWSNGKSCQAQTGQSCKIDLPQHTMSSARYSYFKRGILHLWCRPAL